MLRIFYKYIFLFFFFFSIFCCWPIFQTTVQMLANEMFLDMSIEKRRLGLMEGAAMVSRKWRCHSNRGVRSVKESDQGHWATRGGFSLVCRLRLPWRRYTWKPRPSLCDHSPRSAASPLSNWILHNRSRIIQFFLLPESQNNPAESQTFSNYIFTEKKKNSLLIHYAWKERYVQLKKEKVIFHILGRFSFCQIVQFFTSLRISTDWENLKCYPTDTHTFLNAQFPARFAF